MNSFDDRQIRKARDLQAWINDNGFGPPDPTIELKELLASLWLYTPRHTWTQLTTDQKELWADIIDETHQQQDQAEGNEPGSRLAYTPYDRWWRE